MSSQPVIDYLTKQLFIEKNIVTYRSLSRALTIHVNTAKNELAAYHASVPYQSQTSEATYLLSGEIFLSARHSQDVDMEAGTELDMSSLKLDEREDEDDGEPVTQSRITLVNEKNLEETTSKYSRLSSICIYSLAPAPIRDAGLICTITDGVREADSKEGITLANIVGKIIGENIEVKPGPARTKTKPKQVLPITSELTKAPEPTIPVPLVEKAPLTSTSGQPTKLVPIRASDKLPEKKKIGLTKSSSNFFNTNPKAPEVKKEADDNPEKKGKHAGESGAKKGKSAAAKVAESKQEIVGKVEEDSRPKRGTKRKTLAASRTGSDHDESPSKPKPTIRVQKKRIVSDEEEDVPQPSRRKTKLAEASRAVDSEAERDLHAMMEVDDDQVIHASRNARDLHRGDSSDGNPDAEVDVDETTDPEIIKPRTRKRKEKKQVPVGNNGLRKRRVIKSRTMMRNGYMATEDYSSYESVDEESALPSPATKGKAKPTRKKEKEPLVNTDEPAPAPVRKLIRDPAKPATKNMKGNTSAKSANGGQKKLANFFGPTKAKS